MPIRQPHRSPTAQACQPITTTPRRRPVLVALAAAAAGLTAPIAAQAAPNAAFAATVKLARWPRRMRPTSPPMCAIAVASPWWTRFTWV